MSSDRNPLTEVENLYARAVQIHEALSASEPANREYRLELATFYNNLSDVQRERALFDRARESNDRARVLIDGLARPAPSLAIGQADSHNLRARILQASGWREALPEYARSVEIFRGLEQDPEAGRLPEFHLRYGDLLVNLAVLARENPGVDPVRQLMMRSVGYYLDTSQRIATSGRPDEARSALDTMSRVLPELFDRDRADVMTRYDEVEAQLRQRAGQAGG